MIDFREKSGPEQLAQLSCIDLVGLRSMLEKLVFERVTDDDSVHLVEEFEIEPVGKSRFFEGEDHAAFQGAEVGFELLETCGTFKDPRWNDRTYGIVDIRLQTCLCKRVALPFG